MIIELIVFLITFALVYFWYIQKKGKDFLKSKDVKFLPGYFFYGNTYGSMTESKHLVEEFIEAYNAFPGERYVGFLEGSKPAIIIRDPELIKAITVKNFDHFTDHKEFFPSNDDVFAKSVFSMTGETWKDMRATLTPAFTGSKMRLMIPSMAEVANNVVEHLKQNTGEIIDLDELMRRYANDVIAAAGFGLEVNSFKDKDNEFYRIGQKMFQFTFKQKVTILLFTLVPYITKLFRMKLIADDVEKFFKHIATSTMEYREKNKIERPDMIQLLMEASKGTLKPAAITDDPGVGFATTQEMVKLQVPLRKWTVEDLAGQVFIFFSAGYETSASTIVMAVHELTLNHVIQEKLYSEVKTFNDSKNLTYDNIAELKYLDAVLNETLRKWSPGLFMDRLCVKPYDLPPPRPGANSVRLNPGDLVYNMVNAIHMDSNYYPDPDVFDPDRFSDENKHKIAPFTFMPFGVGLRNCIGSRFAILELKVLLYHLILNFKFVKCEKTTDPIRLLSKGFVIKAANGSYVKFEKRV